MQNRREFLLGMTARYPELKQVDRVTDIRPDLAERLVDANLTDDDLSIVRGFTDEEVAEAERQIIAQFDHVQQFGV